MFGFITRTEHDRVVAERDDALALVQKLTHERDAFRITLGLERSARAKLQERLARFHTIHGPGGRFVKAETQA